MESNQPPQAGTAEEPRGSRRRAVLMGMALVAATLVAFGPILRNGFVSYDDRDYVLENAQVLAGLSWAGVKWAFTAGHAGNWHPLTWLSHQLDVQLFGRRAWGHHLTSLLLHAANAVLLFLVLRRATRSAAGGMSPAARDWLCAGVAGLFALHPLRVESVAWVAERKDVLSGFFFMLTLGAYVRYAERRREQEGAGRETGGGRHGGFSALGCYLFALGFFALGLMSKPMLVTVPFVLLLLDYWPLGRWRGRESGGAAEDRPGGQTEAAAAASHLTPHPLSSPGGLSRLFLEKLPFFALAAASCAATVVAQRPAMQPLSNLALGARVSNALVAYARYLGKTFWPLNLATPYPHPGHWPLGLVLLGLVLLAGVTGLVLWQRRRHPFGVTGWFWFLGMLVPVIGLVQVGEQSLADRYTYLPMVGVLIVVIWGVYEAGRRKAGRWRGLKPMLVCLAALVLLGCVLRTRDQCRCWRGSERLYRHALAVSRNNFIAAYNLGGWLDGEGRTDEALTYYRKAVEMQPRYPDPLNNIGCILAGRKQFAEAIPYFEAALRSRPDYVLAHENLAAACRELGRFREAIPHLEVVVKARPEDTGVLNSLANALAGVGRFAEAVPYYEASLRVRPEQVAAHYGLANALVKLGRADEAVAHYRQALQAKPDFAQAQHDLGIALARQGRLEEAVLAMREAARLEAGNATYQINLGRLLAARQEWSEAIACYERAVQLAPGNADAQFHLGKALAAQGRTEAAISHLREALRLRPDHAPARQALQALGAPPPP
ncbi:MAG: tetratricopeptide repeat protein [Verrucomicrobia bacterium]|nr:tetratricopeptide repeat protein [Verrucomicrobiota bacterium]HOW79011.1 tetratricopeptide repeat protein [Verrucomicrobiota bacterium]HRZ70379.1 tetratricopeptide repeat protein [Candidatus Paceibacterota bacterium]